MISYKSTRRAVESNSWHKTQHVCANIRIYWTNSKQNYLINLWTSIPNVNRFKNEVTCVACDYFMYLLRAGKPIYQFHHHQQIIDTYLWKNCFAKLQICLGSDDLTKERIRDDIHGVGEQFVDDFMVMFETYQNNSVTHEVLTDLVSGINIFYN